MAYYRVPAPKPHAAEKLVTRRIGDIEGFNRDQAILSLATKHPVVTFTNSTPVSVWCANMDSAVNAITDALIPRQALLAQMYTQYRVLHKKYSISCYLIAPNLTWAAPGGTGTSWWICFFMMNNSEFNEYFTSVAAYKALTPVEVHAKVRQIPQRLIAVRYMEIHAYAETAPVNFEWDVDPARLVYDDSVDTVDPEEYDTNANYAGVYTATTVTAPTTLISAPICGWYIYPTGDAAMPTLLGNGLVSETTTTAQVLLTEPIIGLPA